MQVVSTFEHIMMRSTVAQTVDRSTGDQRVASLRVTEVTVLCP